MTLLDGNNLGPYRIIKQIGKGGMATIYKAFQPGMDRYVAIKVLPPTLADDEQFVQRFQQEARAISKLEHPRILPVYDYGEQDGVMYIVLRYVDSGTLKDRMAQGRLSLAEVTRIISQVASALEYAHQEGVIHRDVKPANVLLDKNGNVYLMDFGLARIMESSVQLSATGVSVGTPAYMSPEQGKGEKVDSRSDIYSLGVMLYEMVTGQVPYEAETPLAVLIKHISNPLPLPSAVFPEISASVERVILKALAKEPDDRYQTAGELANGLQTAVSSPPLQPAPIPQPPPSPKEQLSFVARMQKTWQQPVGKAMMLAAAAVFLIAFGFLLSRLNRVGVGITSGEPTAPVAELVDASETPLPIETPLPTETPTPSPAPSNEENSASAATVDEADEADVLGIHTAEGYSVQRINNDLFGPVEIDINANGNILVANAGFFWNGALIQGRDFISLLSSDGETIQRAFIDGLTGSSGIAIDSQNNIYVSQSAALPIRKYDADGNFLLAFEAHRPQFTDPNSLTLTQDNRLLLPVEDVSADNQWRILAFDTQTGERLADFIPPFDFEFIGSVEFFDNKIYISGLGPGGTYDQILVAEEGIQPLLYEYNHLLSGEAGPITSSKNGDLYIMTGAGLLHVPPEGEPTIIAEGFDNISGLKAHNGCILVADGEFDDIDDSLYRICPSDEIHAIPTEAVTPVDTIFEPGECVEISNGLIGWWPGEGNAEELVFGNDGTLIAGTSFAAGKVGQAFSFDGDNDFIGISVS